jgi:hypothetical protein
MGKGMYKFLSHTDEFFPHQKWVVAKIFCNITRIFGLREKGHSINSQLFLPTLKPLNECWGHALQLFEIPSGLINPNANF